MASKSLRCCKIQRKKSKRWLGYANRKSIFSSSSRASANVVLPWRSGRVSAFDADASFGGTSAWGFGESPRLEGSGPIPGVAPFIFNVEDVERKNVQGIDQSRHGAKLQAIEGRGYGLFRADASSRR